MKYFPGIILSLFFFASCANTENNKQIIGNWQGAEWLVDGQASGRNAAETSFSFDEKGHYTFTYSGTTEAGTYKVENDMLFTKPAGGQEIMVKIHKLTADSLVFNMNRSGAAELLTLLKK